jgi:hypothetical protein
LAVKVGVGLGALGVVLSRFRPRTATALLLAGAFVNALPFGLTPIPLGPPDQEVRDLVARAESHGWALGAWDDPRVGYYAGRRVPQAILGRDWDRVDYFVLSRKDLDELRRGGDFQGSFLAFLDEHYRVEDERGGYTAFLRREPADPVAP